MSKIIKVGFCVAYDWNLLEHSLTPVYPHADVICLSLDKSRRSWAGQSYEFDEEKFFSFIRRIDSDSKIEIIEGDFSNQQLTSRQNCNLQRTSMAEHLGTGGWHIQIDVDEYFLNFGGFCQYLLEMNANPTGREKPFNVCVNLIPVYKKLSDGYLLVDFKSEIPENAPFATNVPDYQRARNNGHFNKLSPYFAVHETWARSEEELRYKLSNWGHSSEELKEESQREKYIRRWIDLNESNFEKVKNLHPATPATWPGLKFVQATTMEQLTDKIGEPYFPLSGSQLKWRNNRNIARLKQLFSVR